jgi:hypothetical protein
VYVRLAVGSQKEPPSEARDALGLFVECEMAGVENVNFSAGHLASVRFGLFDLERWVEASPQHEERRLAPAKPLCHAV